MNNPLISVVMSIYNGERYLREAIKSILNQTWKDFEYIVVDDGSTDSSLAILQSIKDERLRIIANETNLGQTRCLNRGLQLARGQYIARQDADDLSLPARFEQQVAFLDTRPEIGLLGTCVIKIDESGQKQKRHLTCVTNVEIQRSLLLSNQFVHGSVMFRRSCLEKVGSYDERYRLAQDYDLWLRMAEWYEVYNLKEPLYLWRMHAQSISSSRRTDQDRYAEAILAEAIARRNQGQHHLGNLHEQALARYHFQQSIRAYTQRKCDQGQQHLQQALAIDPNVLQDAHFIGYQIPEAGQQLDVTLPRCQAAVKFIDSVMFSNNRPGERTLSNAKKKLLDHFLPGAVFESCDEGQLKLARNLAQRTFINNLAQLRNRGLVSVWLKGSVGAQ